MAIRTGVNYGSNESFRSINEELLKMINDIRGLEDELLAEQYRWELLRKENEEYKLYLEEVGKRS